MNIEFRSVMRARSGDGIFMIIASGFVVLAGAGMAIFASFYSDGFGRVGYSVLVTVALAGCAFLFRSISEFRTAKEWEFCANEDRICWLIRDRSGEKSEGEVAIRDIRALIYHGGDSDSGPYLEFEFIDDSVAHFPSRGLVSGPRLLEFINYWREAHDDIPIKNLQSA